MTERYLEGRSAWVTGGVSGMGRACALVEAAEGNVVDQRKAHLVSEEDLSRTGAEIESHGVRSMAMLLDVCSNESVDAFFETIVPAFEKTDILVKAGGTGEAITVASG